MSSSGRPASDAVVRPTAAASTGGVAPDEARIVARPAGVPTQLMLLFHGFGAGPSDLVPLGQALAREFPAAFIVSVAAPRRPEGGHAWFPVDGISDDNRPGRVAAALPAFDDTVRHWQAVAGVERDAIALVGFSQGAIMALESTRDRPALAGRVVAIAGRFAQLPQQPNPDTTLHLFHGKADPVVPYGYTVEAAQYLVRLGADVTADVLPFVGHEIHPEIFDRLLERLRGHLPRRTWEAAMRAARTLESGDGGA